MVVHVLVQQDARYLLFPGCFLLSTRTAFLPDIPRSLRSTDSLLLSQLTDLRTGDALVVSVVPFSDVLGDLDRGVGTNMAGIPFFLPGKLLFTT